MFDISFSNAKNSENSPIPNLNFPIKLKPTYLYNNFCDWPDLCRQKMHTNYEESDAEPFQS
jgi:hypothetical protein